MKEQMGNIWDFSVDAICITTNGIVSDYTQKKLIMGAGIAKEAKDKFLGIDSLLGKYVNEWGNRCFYIKKFKIISFPTKHHYKDDSDLNLIEKSCKELIEICDKFKLNKVSLPKVGCGLGNLNYELQVKPILEKYLDDRFTVFSF